MIPFQTYHVLSEARLLELLRRARDGEDPGILLAEEYANAENRSA